MDATDKKILELLQTNGRITVKEITQTISLTAPAVSERIKRLEKDGIIEGYTAIITRKKWAEPYTPCKCIRSTGRYRNILKSCK